MSLLKLPYRTQKPRKTGITAITDTGIPLSELRGFLEDYGNFIDLAKIGVGTAYIMPNLVTKLELYEKFEIIPYLGGTLFEKFYSQNKLDEYFQYLDNLSIGWVEISNGSTDISLSERLKIITKIKERYVVISEVGSKNSEKSLTMLSSEWIDEINKLLDIGSRYIILEGRSSGTSGIYEPNGKIKEVLIQDIINSIPPEKIIFEAPKTNDQNFLINWLGANVNLGNINIINVLILEAQRQGLRYETFDLMDK